MALSPNCTNQWAWTDYTTELVSCIEILEAVDPRLEVSSAASLHTEEYSRKSELTQPNQREMWTFGCLLWPMHTDNSLHGDYPCTAWQDWKRSATMIRFSHFFVKTPATDEAGNVSLHTVMRFLNSCSNIPQTDRIDHLFAVNPLNVKFEAN